MSGFTTFAVTSKTTDYRTGRTNDIRPLHLIHSFLRRFLSSLKILRSENLYKFKRLIARQLEEMISQMIFCQRMG